MRINRQELIEQLMKHADSVIDQAATKYEADVAKEKEREDKYAEETGKLWAEYAARINQRVKAGQPVLIDDMPEKLRHTPFRTKTITPERTNTFELRQLIGLLKASPDETVSIASLERAGFSIGRVLK